MWMVATAAEIGGRDSQQDRVEVFASEDRSELLAVLADGMGGHDGGALAAEAVVETARAFWAAHSRTPMRPVKLLDGICRKAHTLANEMGRERGQSPHATYVALHLDHYMAHWAHVGDSRLYMFHDGKLEHQTRDDSLVQAMADAGELSEAEMRTHPDANKVLESVGGGHRPEASLGRAEVASGDGFLLCSDGLWDTLEPDEMGRLVHEEPAASAARMMVKLAVERAGGNADNTTAAVIRMDPVAGQEAALRTAAIAALEELIAVCRDSCMALGEAIDKIEDERLQGTFKEMLAARAVVRDNLIGCLARLGAQPDDHGTTAGTVQRMLARIATALLKNDQMAVVNALEAAEDRIKNRFLDTLKQRLPVEAQNCIQDQLSAVLVSHDLVSALKHANR